MLLLFIEIVQNLCRTVSVQATFPSMSMINALLKDSVSSEVYIDHRFHLKSQTLTTK